MTPEERADWLAWRQEGIGGSDVAAIVGLSPWKSPYALWATKVGLVDEDDESEQMEFGRDAEPMMASWFRRTHPGLDLAGEQIWMEHPVHEWMRATPDGVVVDADSSRSIEDAVAVHEIKVTSDSPEKWEAEIPDHYRAQATWLMAVSGFDLVYFSVLHTAFGRMKRRSYVLERDERDVAWLMDEAAAFWKLVQTGIPPDVDGSESTSHALQRAFEPDRGESVELDRTIFEHLQVAREFLAQQEEDAARYTNMVKALMQSATEGTIDGKPVVTWRPSKAMNVPALLEELRWDEAVKTLDGLGFEVADYLRFGLADFVKVNRKRAETFKTEPGTRRFLLTKQKEHA